MHRFWKALAVLLVGSGLLVGAGLPAQASAPAAAPAAAVASPLRTTQDGYWFTNTQFPGGIGAQIQYYVAHVGGVAKVKTSGYSAYVTNGSCFQSVVLDLVDQNGVRQGRAIRNYGGCLHSISLTGDQADFPLITDVVGSIHGVLSLQTTITGGVMTAVVGG